MHGICLHGSIRKRKAFEKHGRVMTNLQLVTNDNSELCSLVKNTCPLKLIVFFSIKKFWIPGDDSLPMSVILIFPKTLFKARYCHEGTYDVPGRPLCLMVYFLKVWYGVILKVSMYRIRSVVTKISLILKYCDVINNCYCFDFFFLWDYEINAIINFALYTEPQKKRYKVVSCIIL